MIGIAEHGLDVSSQQRDECGRSQAGGDQVQQCRLGVLVEMHDPDRGQEAGDVGQESGPEIEVARAVQTLVVPQEEGDKDTGDNDVSKSQHRHVLGLQTVLEQVLGEDEFDGGLEALGHGDHDVGAEHPEDVVEEEATQEDAAGHDVVQVQQLNPVDGESQAEDVVGDPVLLEEVPDPDAGAEGEQDQVVGRELKVDDVFLLSALPLRELDVVGDLGDEAGDELDGHRADHVGQGEDAEHEEVDGQEQVDVLLGEQLEEDVEPEEGAAGDQGEHGRVPLGHRLRLLAGLLGLVALLPVGLDGSEGPKEDGDESHDDQAGVGDGHALGGGGDSGRGAIDGRVGGVFQGGGIVDDGGGLGSGLVHLGHGKLTSRTRGGGGGTARERKRKRKKERKGNRGSKLSLKMRNSSREGGSWKEKFGQCLKSASFYKKKTDPRQLLFFCPCSLSLSGNSPT